MKEQKFKLKDIPSWNEVEKLVTTMIKKYKLNEVSLRDLCLIGLLATTGMRTSELLVLTPLDFNFKEGLINIKQLKKRGEFIRQTAISPDLKPYLEKYVSLFNENENIFKLTRRQVLNITHKYTEEILGKKFRNHAFRHAYAIRILEKTRDVELCRRLIGHAKIETVKIYLDFTIKDRINEVLEAIKINQK
ncbi:MAG: tyrosine-type recombinase/integrase [Candidatus Methanomethylicaceae archaeon]|nr:tyrosine-type recombinase/integrase [Candidatus Verstraetearchaeota archaeon]